MSNHLESLDQAIAVLKDQSLPELTRNEAIQYLEEDGSQEAIDALISVLSDDDFGVRWAAADALAKLGAKAAPSVLRAILSPDSDDRVRETAIHIFKDNGDITIRSEAQPLVKALHDTSTSIDDLTEAAKLLNKLTS
jgi:HEAT repeat protein